MKEDKILLTFKRHKNKLHLWKWRPFFRIIYKVLISEECLTVTEQEKSLFHKKDEIKTSCKLFDIKCITVNRTMKMYDLIVGLVMLFLAFPVFPLAILSFLFFIWRGIGAVAKIKTVNGDLLVIQSESRNKLIELIKVLKKINPDINYYLFNYTLVKLVKLGMIIISIITFIGLIISLRL